MEKVLFKKEICKGCRLCVSVCPVKIISMSEEHNQKGYNAAFVENQESCISCAACARICPDTVITVYRK